jgi:hemerythrin superfamily protein
MLTNRTDAEGSVFERLVEEHVAIRKLLEAGLASHADDPTRTAAFHQLARMIRAHARAEDEIVFAALDGSHELGGHMRADHVAHAAIAEALDDVEALAPSSPAWKQRLHGLSALLTSHFRDEETVVFPRARFVISAQRAAEMLALYDRDRELALAGMP